MFCINCFHKNTAVANSRPNKKQPQIWRRRYCTTCNTTFTTYERPSLAENKPVLLSSGKTDTFNLGRLIISIAQAFTHSPNEARCSALGLAQTVENILSTEQEVVTPEDISATTHAVLKRFDEIAAIQYAARHQLISSVKRRGRPSLREHAPRIDELPSR
jgi:transcriptional regulator NrdR family protein